MPEPEMWLLYEAAARGIAAGRAGRDGGSREPTTAERKWARLAVDAVLPYVTEVRGNHSASAT